MKKILYVRRRTYEVFALAYCSFRTDRENHPCPAFYCRDRKGTLEFRWWSEHWRKSTNQRGQLIAKAIY